MPELTSRTESPDAVVVQPGTIVPGRARGPPRSAARDRPS